MSGLTKFLFEGLPVRGMLVRLHDSWRELLQCRGDAGAYPPEVRVLLRAAACERVGGGGGWVRGRSGPLFWGRGGGSRAQTGRGPLLDCAADAQVNENTF